MITKAEIAEAQGRAEAKLERLEARLRRTLPEPCSLETIAARDAAKVLLSNWVVALAGGWRIADLLRDVEDVKQQLDDWTHRVAKAVPCKEHNERQT
jgi:hypothetical protein